MKNHSLIFDDFFSAPLNVKHVINAQPMEDIKYQDGVVYPNIAMIPPAVQEEIITKLENVFGPIDVKLLFARYSFAGTKPPHWAHSDREIAEFLGLIYLNVDHPECGTAVLRHIEHGFENHPTDPEMQKVLIADANNRDQWYAAGKRAVLGEIGCGPKKLDLNDPSVNTIDLCS